MIDFTREELLNIAKLSALQLDENELNAFENDLRIVLDYTSQLDSAQTSQYHETNYTANVFRDDKIKQKSGEALLEQAPQREDNYFVVPKIL